MAAEFASKSNPDLPRLTTLCRHCRRIRDFEAAAQHQWDWAAALHKATSMQVRAQKGRWMGLTAKTVRALYRLQNGRCAVSGIELLVPADSKLALRQTLSAWAAALPEPDRCRVPLLVRATEAPEWEIGNIILIATALESLYRLGGSAAQTMMLIRTIGRREFTVPAADLIETEILNQTETQYRQWSTENDTTTDTV